MEYPFDNHPIFIIMEHQQFPSFQVIFLIIITFFTIIMLLKLFIKSKTKQPNLPPGPKKLPFIGNLHQLLVRSPTHRRLRELANIYGSILHLQLGELSTIIISSPEIAKQVMKTRDLVFAQRPFVLAASIILYDKKDIAFAPYGNYWRQMRKICTLELLSTKRVQSFRSIREEQVTKLISTISLAADATVPFNLSSGLLSLSYAIVAHTTLGDKYKDDQRLISIVKDATEIATGFSISELFPSIMFLQLITGLRSRIQKLSRDADRELEKIVEEHKAKKKESRSGDENEQDIVDVLLKFQEDNNFGYPITNESIKAIILDNFIGGSDTSSSTVAWAMASLVKHPRVMQKAQKEVRKVFDGNVDEGGLEELQYLRLVIKETLRLHPVAPLLKRESRENCVINGYDIPAKTRVYINAWAMGRDPNYWIDAETFYPERFVDNVIDYVGANLEFIPFGAGRRMCPGVLFGMANVELTLANLLYHFDWKLPGGKKGEDLDMTEAVGATVRKKDDLVLIPTRISEQA